MVRKKKVGFVVILMMAVVLLCGMNVTFASSAQEKLNIVSTQADKNVKVYSIPIYEGTAESEVFTVLTKTLKERGLLIQATTSVRFFKDSDTILFSHEIIAFNGKATADVQSAEYVTVTSNDLGKLDKYCLELQNKQGYKVDTAYQTELIKGSMTMYIVALSR